VFERFTERARQVVVLAQDEARALRHNYIGTEHLLLGLLREEEGLAARVLESLDVTVEEVRAQIARIVGLGDEASAGQIPFTPRAKKVLELALREALSLGHDYIGSEHILLGLVRVNEGVAARILLEFDADAELIRNETIRMLSGRGREPRARSWSAWEYEILGFDDPGAVTVESLNARGAEGWELVATVGEPGEQRLIFKRLKRSG
jgi:ATP-dependent Clp protease ATP-binding subunit ClpC